MEEKRTMDDVLRISDRRGDAAADEEKRVDSVGDDHKEEIVAEVKLFCTLKIHYIFWNIIIIMYRCILQPKKLFIQKGLQV